MGITVILLGIGLLAAVFITIGYNRLVTLRARYKNGFAQIDVQLKRRYDLIPNLVETAKAYLAHEKETLERVISARNTAMSAEAKVSANPGDAQAMRNLGGAEGALTGALTRFMGVMEAYPDLKAQATTAALMEELSSTENRIGFARQAFNDAVTLYNTFRETIPWVFIAGVTGFQQAELFEITNLEEREAVKVNF